MPSDLIDLPTYIQRTYGYNVWYVCSQFDDAIYYIGSKIENKLYETPEEGQERMNLEDILDGNAAHDPVATRPVTRLTRTAPIIRDKPKVKQT